MLISNRVHLEESRTDILFERGVNTRFDRFRDFACSPPPGEQAAKFDCGQATDGCRRLLSNERLELLGKRLVEIPFRQCAGVEVRPHYRSSRSLRMSFSLPLFRRGMLARRSACDGTGRLLRSGSMRAIGLPRRVTTTSPSHATSSSICANSLRTCRTLRLFIACPLMC